METAIERLRNNGKSPGPDGVIYKILIPITEYAKDAFADLFTKCLRESHFPTEWKVAHLALLRMPNKPPDALSSFRPVCLLNTIGKVLEKVISNRLSAYLENEGLISDSQYGFRPGRSTIDAIGRLLNFIDESNSVHENLYTIVISLDIKNAFNSILWNEIVLALEPKNVPGYLCAIRAYLSNRSAIYVDKNG